MLDAAGRRVDAVDPMIIPAKMQANPDLDVTLVGPPPRREKGL